MRESRDTFMPGPLAELFVRILIHCQGSQDSNASPIDYEQIPSEADNPIHCLCDIRGNLSHLST